jgi:hypothetical protein
LKRFFYTIIILVSITSLHASAFAAKWEKGTVYPKEGHAFKGEVKIGKRKYSTFIKYRDAAHNKRILRPEFIEKVTTETDVYQAIWFDEQVAGYNIWAFGKLITDGEVAVYDVVYPFKNCSCKTSGTYKNNWVISLPDRPLFIIEHGLFNDEVTNMNALMVHLKDYPELREALFGNERTRKEIKGIIEHFNASGQETDRTYQIQGNPSINNPE